MTLTRRRLVQITGAGLGSSYVLASGLAQGNTLKNTSIQRDAYTKRKLYHGVAYYPELWPEDDIEGDIAEMKKLGINVARMGEFAWSSMEPEEGKISLDFFRGVMDRLHEAGIEVVFCTPTATPPVWLTHGHPERCFVDADGNVMSHGARQHASYEHPAVQKACIRIVKACAKALGDHPALIAWQLDNEMKAHVAEDFSDAAVASWHRWLKQRYGSIDALNRAWGTHIWSQYYQRFEQVPAPKKTPFLHNASLSTAYREFNRERIVDFMKSQREAIRAYAPQPITHNDNPAFNLNHEKSMEALDFASYDAYPTDKQWGALIFRSDFYRGAIPGRPFWLMETSSSHNGWLGNHQPPHPSDFLVAEAASVYALGGEAFCYWLWRQQRTGAELPHSAVMSAWNAPGIGYREVQKVSALREEWTPLLAGSDAIEADIAVTYSDRARAMIETEGLDRREGFPRRYRDVVAMWHDQIRSLGYHRGVRFEHAKLDGLRMLVTPAMPYVSSEFAERIIDFVNKGGTWLCGPVTGTRAEDHTVPTDAGLGLVDALAGVRTKFVVPLTNTDAEGEVFGMRVPLSGWAGATEVEGQADSKGKILTGVAKGLSFLTERRLGKGRIVLLSAQPHGDEGKALVNKIIEHYATQANVRHRFEVSDGTVVGPHRDANNKTLWLAVNMNGEGGRLRLPARSRDALTGEPIQKVWLTLSRYERRAIYPGE